MDKIALVSICIPTYNGASYIQEAMASAISQTYPNLEIIVSDDLSQDHTLDIIESFKKKTNIPIKIYHHKPSGIGANWNHCIKNSNGEYIKFLFQDDVLYPNCIEEMLDVFNQDKTLGLVACKREILYEDRYSPEVVNDWLERCQDLQYGLNLIEKNNWLLMDDSLFKSKQFLRSPLNKVGEPSAFMFRRDIINRVGYFREDLKQILDYEFCYRLLKKYNIAIINKNLIKFRLHENQATNKNRINKNNNNDNYSKILYQGYLKYFDDYTKKHFLKKHNFCYKVYYFSKIKFKKILSYIL